MKPRSKAPFWMAGMFALPGLAGCGGSSSSGTPAPLAPRTASAVLADGLTATLTEDRTTVPVGGAVNYTVTLTNATAQPITFQPIYGPGSAPPLPAYLEVTDPSGNVVYPLGPSAQVVYVGPNTTVAPGQSISETQSVTTDRNNGLTIAGGYSRAGNYAATILFGFNPIPAMTGQTGNSQTDKPVGPVGVAAQ